MSMIPLSDIEQLLATGWINAEILDLSRLIQPGQVVTIILSDATFSVPATLPGGAETIGSKQHQFTRGGLVKVRVLERQN